MESEEPEPKKGSQGYVSKIEKDKRIRIVMEWILEDWPSADIISNMVEKWVMSERHAKRYLAEARRRWNDDESAVIDHKRKLKVESLKKLKRSLKESFKGTPAGMNAILRIEREIIMLEGLRADTKIVLKGDKENPIPITTNTKLEIGKLSDEDLKIIIALSKKAAKE